MVEAELIDYEQFQLRVLAKTGIDLRLYRSEQMQRRLRSLVDQSKLGSFREYFRYIERDTSEWTKFLDRITINVTELFRNPEKWERLECEFLPHLQQPGGLLRIWSAGCSIGAEPYTLAMIANRVLGSSSFEVTATDIDENILERAKRGTFADKEVVSVPSEYRSVYLEPVSGGWTVNPEIAERVSFQRHNLLHDEPPGTFDLAVCRNVVIYFTDEAKTTVYRRLAASLRMGGVLLIGGTERIAQPGEFGLVPLSDGFYIKEHLAAAPLPGLKVMAWQNEF
jgi:chemotaxis protein methyltransferase CheR